MADQKAAPTPTFEDLLTDYQENGDANRTSTSSRITGSIAGSQRGDMRKVYGNQSTAGGSSTATPYRSVMTQNPHAENVQLMGIEKSRFSGTIPVLVGASVGLSLGIGISQINLNPDVAAWIALPGDLFIRALKLLVVPMIFSSLTVAVADIMAVGKAYHIGWRCAALNIFTSILGSTQGTMWGLLFKSSFYHGTHEENVMTDDIKVGIQCGNGMFLSSDDDGVVSCVAADSASNSSNFILNDMNSILMKKTTFEKLSFSDQLISIFTQIVPSNITKAFAEGALLSVVMFAMPFGVAVVRCHSGPPSTNKLLLLVRQINSTFLLLIRWIINMAPFAVISLIAGSLVKHEDQLGLLQSVATLIWAMTAGFSFHLLIVLPALLFFFIRKNPYSYLKQMIPAQVFAFGCSSSMATVPVTMRCVEMTKEVTRNLIRFIIPIGATVNMDGSSIYYPIAVIFMAETDDLGGDLDITKLVLMVIVSTIASIGNAPVPNAGLVVVITVWQTVMQKPLPESFSFIVAVDWLIDRMITSTNITGDTVVVRIIADQVDERYEDEN